MSTIIMSACWPLKMSPTQKSVLISLADNANDQGYCWPSLTTICERTCLGRTAVIEAIKWLESAGAITANRDNGAHTKYVVTPKNYIEPVRLPDPSASRTGPSGEQTRPPGGRDPSASRTGPVRQADTNRKEPSRTVNKSNRQDDTRGTRLPKDWKPSAEDLGWAKDARPDLDLKTQADSFRDYWNAKAGKDAVKVDWPATWRNWVRRANGPPRPQQSRPPSGMQNLELT